MYLHSIILSNNEHEKVLNLVLSWFTCRLSSLEKERKKIGLEEKTKEKLLSIIEHQFNIQFGIGLEELDFTYTKEA